MTTDRQGPRNSAGVMQFEPGGYRYIEGVFQYSAGVAAESGYAIVRARLARPLPLLEGFAAVESHLAAIDRPTTAFCACELRSPEPFSEQGFVEFNHQYVGTLERWGLYRGGINPVARTNVCPEFDKPASPSLHAFSYTVPSDTTRGSFIIAGGGEAREGAGDYRNSIVRLGDTSVDGLREKVRFVMTEMERRLAALGFGWGDAVSTQAYTTHDIGSLIRDEIVGRGVTGGLSWHYCRPPVVDIEYEMDVRGSAMEIVI
ncbi:MAG TPA: hypothetical protein VEQ36_03645 [Thermomicrobiales bacterium]|nr:hypothetical protein [Thermomicrobiales bacterium]